MCYRFLFLFRNLGCAGLLNVSQLDFYREGQVWGSLARTDKRAGANSKEEKWPRSICTCQSSLTTTAVIQPNAQHRGHHQ
jgi:hypothetical protein